MKQLLLTILLCSLTVPTIASERTAPPPQTIKTDKSQQGQTCKNPRPQMCTQIYMPVCALLKDGEYKTYASDCTACSDEEVISYTADACKEPLK